jgi:hypothetical protein
MCSRYFDLMNIQHQAVNKHHSPDSAIFCLSIHVGASGLLLSCCRTAVGVGQRALSLSAHTAGRPPPTPGPGEGGVSSPYSRIIANTTVTSLLRGAGGFNHLRESLNPSLHTGGPRRGHSFRHRLHRWRWWYGSWSVEMTSYLYVGASEYVTARLRRHGEDQLCPVDLATVIRQVSAFLKAWNWFLRPTCLTLVIDVPSATSMCASICFSLLYFM